MCAALNSTGDFIVYIMRSCLRAVARIRHDRMINMIKQT